MNKEQNWKEMIADNQNIEDVDGYQRLCTRRLVELGGHVSDEKRLMALEILRFRLQRKPELAYREGWCDAMDLVMQFAQTEKQA